jgi:hypothetical protein
LFTLTASAKNNAEVSFAIANVTAYRSTNWWVVTALGGMGPEVDDIVPLIRQHINEVLFQGVASVVGANCNSGHLIQSSRGVMSTT